ncbi:MAG TPA: hypothetical protein VF585_11490 [Chthoniobacterales bacterium]
MKILFLWLLSMCLSVSLMAQGARPVVKTLEQEERVPVSQLGISLILPEKSTLIGTGVSEATNYIFPWFKTPFGSVDIAFADAVAKASLNEMVAEFDAKMRKRGSGIVAVDEGRSEVLQGIPVVRISCLGDNRYRIVRYFLLSSDGRLGFLHLHGANDLNELEKVVRRTIKRIEPSAEPEPAALVE